LIEYIKDFIINLLKQIL